MEKLLGTRIEIKRRRRRKLFSHHSWLFDFCSVAASANMLRMDDFSSSFYFFIIKWNSGGTFFTDLIWIYLLKRERKKDGGVRFLALFIMCIRRATVASARRSQ